VQALLGVNEATVPPDIWPEIEGFRQYEDVGRHPFASLTANGMAAVSLFPIVLLLGLAQRSLVGTVVTLFLALLVGVLTLTRSYLAIVLLLVVLMVPLARTRVRVWLPMLALAVIGAVAGLRAVDPELLSLSLRLEGDVSSLRADIWTYTLQNLDVTDWLLGMGFGTDVWARFFAPMALVKELQSPHSALLEVTGQFGVVGLAVYLALVATVVRAYLHNRLEPATAGVALALLLIMARELLAASYIFSPSILATYFWILFGMALAQLPDARGPARDSAP
jgi:O-antigen ligase